METVTIPREEYEYLKRLELSLSDERSLEEAETKARKR